MQITNCGRGVHKREVKGVERLRKLPSDWYAFTNLDLALGPGRSREIDVVVVADDRIFLIDLKDWDGCVESDSGNLAAQRPRHRSLAGVENPSQRP